MGVFSNFKTLFKDKRHGKNAPPEDQSIHSHAVRADNSNRRDVHSTPVKNLKGQPLGTGRTPKKFTAEGVQKGRSGPSRAGLNNFSTSAESATAGTSRNGEPAPRYGNSDRVSGRALDPASRWAMAGYAAGVASNSSTGHGIQARNSLGSTDEDSTTRETCSPVLGGSIRRGRGPRVSFDSSGHGDARLAQAEMERSWIAPHERRRAQPSGIGNRTPGASIGHGTDHAGDTIEAPPSVETTNDAAPIIESVPVVQLPRISKQTTGNYEGVDNSAYNGEDRRASGGLPAEYPLPTDGTTNMTSRPDAHERGREVECEGTTQPVIRDRQTPHNKHYTQPVIVEEVLPEQIHERALSAATSDEQKASPPIDMAILGSQSKQNTDIVDQGASNIIVIDKSSDVNVNRRHRFHDVVQPVSEEETVDQCPLYRVTQVSRELSDAVAQPQFFAPIFTNGFADKQPNSVTLNDLQKEPTSSAGKHCKSCTCNVVDEADSASSQSPDEPDLSNGTHRTLPPPNRFVMDTF